MSMIETHKYHGCDVDGDFSNLCALCVPSRPKSERQEAIEKFLESQRNPRWKHWNGYMWEEVNTDANVNPHS